MKILVLKLNSSFKFRNVTIHQRHTFIEAIFMAIQTGYSILSRIFVKSFLVNAYQAIPTLCWKYFTLGTFSLKLKIYMSVLFLCIRLFSPKNIFEPTGNTKKNICQFQAWHGADLCHGTGAPFTIPYWTGLWTTSLHISTAPCGECHNLKIALMLLRVFPDISFSSPCKNFRLSKYIVCDLKSKFFFKYGYHAHEPKSTERNVSREFVHYIGGLTSGRLPL